MGELLLLISIFAIVVSALMHPWLGVTSYYLLSLLGPQYIWWWSFEGLHVSLLIAIPTFIGVALKILNKNNYDFKFLLNRQSFWMAVLWVCITNSYISGPFVDFFASSGLGPDQIFSITNKMFLFYFCSIIEINKLEKLRYLLIVFALSTLYLIYWANSQYFSQNWFQFNMGRLMGPSNISGGSIYGDENNFAMLFVTGIPFIYYLGKEVKRRWQRYSLWAAIPLGWHAIFLTGSRGGLLGLITVFLIILVISRRKHLALLLLVFFSIFYQWQAGSIMKERSDTISNFEEESSAEARIIAWQGGLRMIGTHPISGVGLGSFVTALPVFIDSKPKVAHNTLIQFTAESGIGAGLAYLVLLGMFFLNSRKICVWCKKHEESKATAQVSNFNDAITASFGGLIVCSLFLSLNVFEVFFFLLIFSNALFQICRSDFELKNI